MEVFYDILFIILDDEFGSYYLLIVEWVCYVEDYFWMEIVFNLCVCFYDGMLIIVCDVVFIFNKFMIEGVLQFCMFYKGIIVKVIVLLIVCIDFGQFGKENMLSLLSLLVMFEVFWCQYKFSDLLLKLLLVSGLYCISVW